MTITVHKHGHQNLRKSVVTGFVYRKIRAKINAFVFLHRKRSIMLKTKHKRNNDPCTDSPDEQGKGVKYIHVHVLVDTGRIYTYTDNTVREIKL